MSDRILLQANDGAMAEIHLRGAHVTRWQPAGEQDNRLFVSDRPIYAAEVPIRGGVPVIFPQFAGEGPLPKHGFARTAPWVLHDSNIDHAGEAVATFTLAASSATRAIWNHTFLATLTVRVGGARLHLQLQVTNTGDWPFEFTSALHSYLAVAEISEVSVHGLSGLHYRDTADAGRHKLEQAEPVRIAGEVDRNYFDAPERLTLKDGVRILQLHQQGFADTVLWNPGAARSQGFADLGPQDYRRFLCIEAAAIGRPIHLEPGMAWQGGQTLVAGSA